MRIVSNLASVSANAIRSSTLPTRLSSLCSGASDMVDVDYNADKLRIKYMTEATSCAGQIFMKTRRLGAQRRRKSTDTLRRF